jgi:hypothetical protein
MGSEGTDVLARRTVLRSSTAVVLARSVAHWSSNPKTVQVKHDRDPPRTSPAHQLEAGGVTAGGQQHMRSKAPRNLVGQSKEARRSLPVGSALQVIGVSSRTDTNFAPLWRLPSSGALGR